MKRSFAVFAFSLACLVPGIGLAQNSLSIGSDSVTGLMSTTIPVGMDNDCDVEGYVLAVAYDTAVVSVTNVSVMGTRTDANNAELIVPEIFEAQGGFTLGVVMDAGGPPFDGQTIPAGSGTIANFDVMPDIVVQGVCPDDAIVTDFAFTDGTFNNPPLDNIIVCGGFSIGAAQGLGLNDGQLQICPPPPDQLCIEDTDFMGTSGCVRILIDASSGPIQGFVLAIGHNAAELTLNDINLDGTATAAAGAEFVVPNLNPAGGDGGTLGVVLDFDPPFGGQTIPVGNGVHLANFCYTCTPPDPFPAPGTPPVVTTSDLTFVDGTLGNPALDNVIVVAGLSLNPSQKNGQVTCTFTPGALQDTTYCCGVMDAEGNVVDPEGGPGEIIDLCFFYTEGSDPNPNDGIPECVGDNIQGFQLALTFDCNLCFIQGSFSIEGSILEAVGAEFVTHSVDNDPNDGDGCELTVGILLDALPPFDRQTAPPSCEKLLIGCIAVEIKEDAPCNTCLPVSFTDGVNGSENVPIENIVVIGNESIQNFETFDCNVCVILQPEFNRGDCNGDLKVDLADASTVLAQQFQGFPVPCEDACDANDDGKINLADTVFILNYLFDSGPPPPAPGPDIDPGPDPTKDDNLGCDGGIDPCGP